MSIERAGRIDLLITLSSFSAPSCILRVILALWSKELFAPNSLACGWLCVCVEAGVSSALCVEMSAENCILVPAALSYPKGLCSKFTAQVELENLKGNEKLETPLPPIIHQR